MAKDHYVLGINYRPLEPNDIGHHPAAAILRNGEILAMGQEERFVRVKEAPGQFPSQAIRFCLSRAGISIHEVDAIGWNWNPIKALERAKRHRGPLASGVTSAVEFTLRHTPLQRAAPLFSDTLFPQKLTDRVRSELRYWFGANHRIPFFGFDHHLAHAASAFFASGFVRATIVTWDGWGDHLSGTIARGEGSRIEVLEELPFSQFSIGRLNDFVFDFLRTSEKGNLMGLAAYGTPRGLLDDLVDPATLTMRMDRLNKRAPFPEEFTARAGQPRRQGELLEDRHKDLAADLQKHIEAFAMKILKRALDATGVRDVCFAGGCALNATLNGKIGRSGLVDRIFVQPEPGDAGGALGAAYLAQLRIAGSLPVKEMRHVYWGPSYTTDEILEQVDLIKVPHEVIPESHVPEYISSCLVDQKIVGWFELGSEWGPRALGARSILADPRREETRDRVNRAIKYRDWWRPFAPSMLAEVAGDYLEDSFHAPFMIVTFTARERCLKDMAAVVHRDGTARPQMVLRDVNPLYYDTIQAFGRRTGVPMLLNTSFNLKGEPIVNTPRDAIRTFFSSGMDVLILNNVVLTKLGARRPAAAQASERASAR
jgi:carbamoyltransferase